MFVRLVNKDLEINEKASILHENLSLISKMTFNCHSAEYDLMIIAIMKLIKLYNKKYIKDVDLSYVNEDYSLFVMKNGVKSKYYNLEKNKAVLKYESETDIKVIESLNFDIINKTALYINDNINQDNLESYLYLYIYYSLTYLIRFEEKINEDILALIKNAYKEIKTTKEDLFKLNAKNNYLNKDPFGNLILNKNNLTIFDIYEKLKHCSVETEFDPFINSYKELVEKFYYMSINKEKQNELLEDAYLKNILEFAENILNSNTTEDYVDDYVIYNRINDILIMENYIDYYSED